MAKERLTVKQHLFLDARATGIADADAARMVSVAMSSVHRWKNLPAFWDRYRKATGEIEETLEEAIVLEAEDRQQLAADQAEALTKILPEIVQEHIRIALRSDKDADRLRAIEKLYSAIGFGKDEAPPPSRQNKVFLQMLSLMAPQVAAEAARRGLPVASTIKDVIAEDFAQTMLRLEQEGTEGEEDEEGLTC